MLSLFLVFLLVCLVRQTPPNYLCDCPMSGASNLVVVNNHSTSYVSRFLFVLAYTMSIVCSSEFFSISFKLSIGYAFFSLVKAHFYLHHSHAVSGDCLSHYYQIFLFLFSNSYWFTFFSVFTKLSWSFHVFIVRSQLSLKT